jgi:hypothetical protein
MSEVKKRFMKVYQGRHSNSFKPQPLIRLCGNYLRKQDFKIGDVIEVTITKEQIVITKLPQVN